jgi:hypothetical protein
MLLKDINPSYASDDDPAGAAGYPCGDWAQFTIVLEGLSQPITGRIAFRHYVVDVASNGWYVGLDDVAYSGATSADPTETATATASPSPSAAATATPTETPTATATASPSPSATATATLTPAQPKQYFALVRYDAGARRADSGH